MVFAWGRRRHTCTSQESKRESRIVILGLLLSLKEGNLSTKRSIDRDYGSRPNQDRLQQVVGGCCGSGLDFPSIQMICLQMEEFRWFLFGGCRGAKLFFRTCLDLAHSSDDRDAQVLCLCFLRG
jgi:hypothetical protein